MYSPSTQHAAFVYLVGMVRVAGPGFGFVLLGHSLQLCLHATQLLLQLYTPERQLTPARENLVPAATFSKIPNAIFFLFFFKWTFFVFFCSTKSMFFLVLKMGYVYIPS